MVQVLGAGHAFVAAAVTAAVMWFNITLGILGRALMPELPVVDEIYPRLINDYLGPGLVGLVVAGVLAGGISTYDSIGSSIGAGIAYGLSSFAGDFLAWPLPFWWTNTWWAYLWSIAVTATAMLIVTVLRGWETEEHIRRLIFSRTRQPQAGPPEAFDADSASAGNWLARTQSELVDSQTKLTEPLSQRPWFQRPALWAVLYLAVMAFLNLYLLW